MDHVIPRIALRSSIVLAVLALGACKEDPPDIEECPVTSGGETGCDVPDPDPPPQGCADPEFDTAPPMGATEFECEGRAGGAIVYNQVVAPNGGGGPGDVQTDPAVTEFPSTGNDVSACCDQPEEGDEQTACERDCARAACNRILEELREQVDPMQTTDPSNGKCTSAFLSDEAEQDCRDNVRDSLQSWIDQLEVRYDECVEKAAANHDSTLPYEDPTEEFAQELLFDDWGCSTSAYGCFFMARLRPFCEIDGFTEESTCMAAGNLPDPAAEGGEEAEPDSSGGGGVVDPFGDVSELITCSTQTTCTIESELQFNVETHIYVFYEEGVVFTLGTYGSAGKGFQVSGLNTGEDSKELFDELSFMNGDVITHVNSVALDSWADVADVVEDLETLTSWSVTVKRLVSGTWRTRNYSLTVASTITAPPTMPEARTPGSGDGPDANDGGTTSSCACQTTNSTPSVGFLALVVGGLLRRRHRRA